MQRMQAFVYFFKVKSNVTSVEGAEYLGHQLMSRTLENVDWAKELVFKNRGMTICEVSNTLCIPAGYVQRILTDNLNTHQISAKSVPHFLRDEQMNCGNMYQGLQEKLYCLPTPHLAPLNFSLSPKPKLISRSDLMIQPQFKQNQGMHLPIFKPCTS
jgi:hypothetical protein